MTTIVQVEFRESLLSGRYCELRANRGTSDRATWASLKHDLRNPASLAIQYSTLPRSLQRIPDVHLSVWSGPFLLVLPHACSSAVPGKFAGKRRARNGT